MACVATAATRCLSVGQERLGAKENEISLATMGPFPAPQTRKGDAVSACLRHPSCFQAAFEFRPGETGRGKKHKKLTARSRSFELCFLPGQLAAIDISESSESCSVHPVHSLPLPSGGETSWTVLAPSLWDWNRSYFMNGKESRLTACGNTRLIK